MEWRLFVPIIDESRPELQQIYSEIDHLFQQFIPDQEEESRSDSYFVTSHEFGVKYRHGKKLELKVKSKTPSRLGIELWTKSKLGKSEIDLQIDNVLDHLGRSGYQEEQAKFRSIIQRKKTVEVVKSRKVGLINPVSVEYCKLSARGQRWVSVAVESYSAEANCGAACQFNSVISTATTGNWMGSQTEAFTISFRNEAIAFSPHAAPCVTLPL